MPVEAKARRARPGRRVRLGDLAARCGVSISTVSRALAGEPGVRPEIRSAVLAAARAANYATPSSIAGRRVIVAASSAAMIDYVRNQFTLHVLDGLRQQASVLGIEIVTRPISSPDDEVRVLEEALADDAVAGLLFLTLDDDEMLAAAREFSKPVVLLNGDDPHMRLSSVTPCNRAAARLATDHLIGLGHERILFLLRPGRRTIGRRLEGWREALRNRGFAAGDEMIVTVDDWLPELAATAITERITRTGLDFTAILGAGDSLAMGAQVALQTLGFSVPGDVSVMGMDNLPQGAFLDPPLTTMQIPMREIGAVALDLLRDDVTDPGTPARRVELACHMVERHSTARISIV